MCAWPYRVHGVEVPCSKCSNERLPDQIVSVYDWVFMCVCVGVGVSVCDQLLACPSSSPPQNNK